MPISFSYRINPITQQTPIPVNISHRVEGCAANAIASLLSPIDSPAANAYLIVQLSAKMIPEFALLKAVRTSSIIGLSINFR